MQKAQAEIKAPLYSSLSMKAFTILILGKTATVKSPKAQLKESEKCLGTILNTFLQMIRKRGHNKKIN